MIKGLDHVTIIVKDLDGAVAQYRKLLGAGAVQRADPAPGAEPAPARGWKPVVFSFGSTNIELITPTADTGPWAQRLAARGDGVYLVALKVDNLRQTVEELRGKGVRLAEDPGPGTGPITGRVLIHPSAANGVMISLLER